MTAEPSGWDRLLFSGHPPFRSWKSRSRSLPDMGTAPRDRDTRVMSGATVKLGLDRPPIPSQMKMASWTLIAWLIMMVSYSNASDGVNLILIL